MICKKFTWKEKSRKLIRTFSSYYIFYLVVFALIQIKEIRKACRDSESGLEKMAVGHHIHERAHVVQKAKNNKTGEEELNQEFINLDEGN